MVQSQTLTGSSFSWCDSAVNSIAFGFIQTKDLGTWDGCFHDFLIFKRPNNQINQQWKVSAVK